AARHISARRLSAAAALVSGLLEVQKMKRLLLIIVCASPFLVNADALEFTATSREYVAEGIKFRQLVFKDGDRQVVFEPPQQWTCNVTGNGLQLVPTSTARAEATIQAVPLAPDVKPGMDAAPDWQQAFLQNLPPGSQGGTLVSDAINPIAFQGGVSYEMTGSYTALGEKFIRSRIIAIVPGMQVTFTLTARKADFDKLHLAFRSSIMSWHWVEADTRGAVATAGTRAADRAAN
ncbi:MAG: hypothetical protein ACJ8JD_03475, partial [Chthoniobacterales bacterium]